MGIEKRTWIKKAKLNGSLIGILVLPRSPHIGSRIFLRDYKADYKHCLFIVIKIDDEYVYLERA